MIVRWVGVLAAATAGFTASQAAAPQSLTFNCDAVGGAVSTMDAEHLSPTTAISGNLRALQARHDNNLSPTATVKLSSRKDFVALQMTPIEPNSSTFLLYVRNGDAKEEERTMLGQVALNTLVPFRIALNGKDVQIQAAGQAVSVQQSFRGKPNVGVSCSTGHFLFDNVKLG
jgi:hypothetical protein